MAYGKTYREKRKKEMTVMKRGITEIDPEIRGLIVDLNKRGYKTVSSCAGHYGSPEYLDGPPTEGHGYVMMKGKIPADPWERMDFLEKLIPIFKKHGCKITSEDNSTAMKGNFSIGFKPIGQPHKIWIKSKEFKKETRLITDLDLRGTK
jgi:hypothetical protein